MTSFNDLGLNGPILRALEDERHTIPTPIQAQAIPHVMAGRDILGIAQTGTGKTAAFALPILHRLSNTKRGANPRSVRVLVLSPTRELSTQILERFQAYGRHFQFRSALVIGGTPIGKQIRAMAQGNDVVIATPGRLLDLVEQRALSLSEVEVLVLDEVDQMLDLGFIHAIRAIAAKLPKVRQNLFFSATMPPEIQKLAEQLLTDPVRVAVTPVAKTADRISQQVMHVEGGGKAAALAGILRDPAVERTLVFTRTKHGADKVVRSLNQARIAAEAIHGNKSQPQRDRTMNAFRAGKIRVLVATDIAARGIDVENISHVIQYDLPHVPESYVHRIGRTARAGAGGQAIVLVSREERPLLRAVEKLIRQSIPVIGAPPASADAFAVADGPITPDVVAEWTPERPQHRRPQNGRPQREGRNGRGRGERRFENAGPDRLFAIADTAPRAGRSEAAPAERNDRGPGGHQPQRAGEGHRRREGGNGHRPHGNGGQRPGVGRGQQPEGRSQPAQLAAAVQQGSDNAGEARREGNRNHRHNGQRPGGEGRPFHQKRRGGERHGQHGRPAATSDEARREGSGKPNRFRKRNNGQRFAGNRASAPA
ncbi:MAG: DEAD/DEAH box helicase [Bauldia sp.]|nr:DEAD/DEAH box helicase [Bauldia sp.]